MVQNISLFFCGLEDSSALDGRLQCSCFVKKFKNFQITVT